MNTRSLLTIESTLPEERIQDITRDLQRDLNQAGVEAKPIEVPAKPGARGDAVSLGQLSLAFVTSGAVTALLECLKVYLQRERRLVVKLTKPDGSVLEVNAQNINENSIRTSLMAGTNGP